ncbi:hypothetical protein KIN20_008853 [Parelaphostrongylus tenuis]|uniref:Uncharacterized protein n=1 Tax=Parelaphostrongylus tenuis TaxID=148309 RepID=A0AAD5QKU7_PARTN|nr:hypothetical protein KIN20_008853 [Parelaphostrongylus tenuis]
MVNGRQDLPAPEQSCSNLIKREENGAFPVISITFDLNESPEIDKFPENSFRDTIAGALRVSPADILLLRINCQGTDDFLTVQFAVLKKFALEKTKVRKNEETVVDDDGGDDYNDSDVNENHKENRAKDNEDDDSGDEKEDDDSEESIKYHSSMFVDAESVAARMKAMGHLSQIADLQVDSIEFTRNIIDLEYQPDNSTLILQAIAVVVSIVLTMLIGIWATCRDPTYSDDLQKV